MLSNSSRSRLAPIFSILYDFTSSACVTREHSISTAGQHAGLYQYDCLITENTPLQTVLFTCSLTSQIFLQSRTVKFDTAASPDDHRNYHATAVH